MVTRKIKTANGPVWAFYPNRETAKRYDGDATLLTVTDEQVVFLTAHPEAEWDGNEFVLPEAGETADKLGNTSDESTETPQ